MSVLQIAVLVVLAAAVGQLRNGRQLAMLGISALAVFWLQPDEPAPGLRFWLPVATLGIVVVAWILTASAELRSRRLDWGAALVLFTIVVVVELNHYFGADVLGMAGTPRVEMLAAVFVGIAALALVLARTRGMNRIWLIAGFVGILLLFIMLKTPFLENSIEHSLLRIPVPRAGAGGVIPFTWMGFSYVAFRLLHTIRDRLSGRLPPVTLGEYANYVVFFPAFTAGPIDRVERFGAELRTPLPLTNADWLEAGTRLFVGLFKKFVLADLLAVISISDPLVSQVKSAAWLWVFLYAYSFRIYLDFSGYTDIAIGMGRLMGIRLPENFAAPYLKPNVTQFWNSWHMSLTQWFRSYVFNPLSRALRSAERPLPVWLIILVVQISTMLLIGLWHGVTWGFAIWGLWHGLGLFVHNRWSNFTRSRMPAWTQAGRGQAAMHALGVFLTFNFVALGWLFFNLSSPELAWRTLLRLVGLA